MLLRMSAVPFADTCLVLPSGEPWSTMSFACASAHCFHAVMPAFSFSTRCFGSIAFHASMASGEPVNTARNFFMVASCQGSMYTASSHRRSGNFVNRAVHDSTVRSVHRGVKRRGVEHDHPQCNEVDAMDKGAMDKGLVAHASTSIDAPKSLVWDALVTPEAIREYMFGADVESDWTPGSRITWTGEMKGKPYKDKGEILEVEPERALRYSHFSPQSGKPDTPENYHTVSIRLAGSGDRTEVSLDQDNNPDASSRQESEKNWSAMLDGLKQYVERSASH